ncbi:MAG: hypothetical protein WCQ67_02525 [Treponema sp.]
MKKIMALAVVITAAAALFAYNPPVGGESVYRLSEPNMLASASSASGGPLFTVVPGSITYNPALTALNQRTVFDLSYTGLVDTNNINQTENKYAQAFQLGLIIPTRWCVPTVTVEGAFSALPEMNIGNQITIHSGVSKDVTDNFYVGMNMYTGFYFGYGSDFTIGVDLGVLYKMNDISFLKSPRLGISLMNLGKPITGSYDVTGIDGTSSGTSYPGILTPHVSFATTLFSVKKMSGGFSFDLAAPFFQNAVINTALGFSFLDFINLSVGWEANIRELVNGNEVNLPSIGISVKFAINSSGISKKNEDWAKSEITTSASWQQLYGGIQAISGGMIMDLGMKDTSAPEIILWNGEE